MTLSLSTLRTELRDHLGVDEDEWDNTEVDLILNRSWWELMDKMNFREKESSYDITTVQGTREYTCDTLQDAIQAVSLTDPTSNKQVPLERSTLQTYLEKWDSDEESEGQPDIYVRRNDQIIFHPTPDDAYTITVYHKAVLSDIPEAGPDVPQSWHEVILYGGIWRGYLKLGDFNRANAMKAHQVSLIESQDTQVDKDKEDSRYATFEVLRRPYP